MKTPLDIISGYGVSTTSYVQAIRDFTDVDRPIHMTQSQYERGIADLLAADGTPCFTNEKEARIYFLYLVQETVRAYQTEVPDMGELWDVAQLRAQEMIEKNPWAIKEYATEQGTGEPKLDASGAPKMRKGAKKELAEALYVELNDGTNDRPGIIKALMDEVGLSKPGATTYFHNLKKQYGFEGPKTERKKRERKVHAAPKPPDHKAISRKGPTKAQQAQMIYTSMADRPKEEVIAAIIKQTGTSKAGANTYYCSCKKEQ